MGFSPLNLIQQQVTTNNYTIMKIGADIGKNVNESCFNCW